MREPQPYDVSYRFDSTLRPVPNDPSGMALAVQYHLALADDPQSWPAVKARELGRAGIYQAMLGELEAAEVVLNAALRLNSSTDDVRLGIVLRLRLGQVYQWQGRYAEADELFEHTIARCRAEASLGSHLDFALQHAGKSKFDQRQYRAAAEYFQAALELREQKGDTELIASTLQALEETQRLVPTEEAL